MVRYLEWHVSEFIENLQEVIIVDNVIKAGGEEIHEVHQFSSLDASHILEDHIDKVILLNDASVVWIMLSKL